MEREIEAEVRRRPPIQQPRPANVAPPSESAPAPAMPDYVEHRDGATEIGKLSAEAIVREYEAAAKEIEAMGAELVERVKQCDDSRCIRRDRGANGNRRALSRGGQARLRSDRELFAGDSGGPQDLHRIEGEDRRSAHYRQSKTKKN
jgi:hypothetical protein